MTGVRKKNFIERRRSTGAQLILRGVLDPRGSYLEVEEISKDGVVRSARIAVAEVPSMLTGLNEFLRWCRGLGGQRPPMEGG